MGSYGGWVEWKYGNNSTENPSKTFTGVLVVPEVNQDEPYDPCAEPSLAMEPTKTGKRFTATRGIGSGKFTMQLPEDEEEVVDVTNIILRPISGGVELIGCNDVSMDCCANKVEKHDSYYIEREAYSWEVDFILDDAISKYASGVDGDSIYFFGGCRGTDWLGTNGFFKYNTKTKELTELSNGGLEIRSDAYGWCMNGYFYMYGGYTHSNTTQEFINTFHKYKISTGVWSQLTVPMGRITNKMVGGHGRLYIGNAMEAGSSSQGWDYNGACYEFDTSSDSWSAPYNGNDYTAEVWTNFETFIFHKGSLYYFNEEKLMQILPDQFVTTVGVDIQTLKHNPKMATYGDYIIFSHGLTDGGGGVVLETKWFNTVTRMFGTFGVIGDVPQSAIGFDIWVIDDCLYMIGGIPEEGAFEHRIWKLCLKQFFDTLDTCGATPVPPDTMREKTITMCKEYAGHPCP